MLNTLNIKIIEQLKEENLWHNWLNSVNTKIILPADHKVENLDKILGLSKFEIDKLHTFSPSARMFLIKQDSQSIAAELSIGGLPGITKILSCGTEELETYQSILQNHPGGPNEWASPLYDSLDGKK
jgi:type IV secretion system protein VirB4